MRPGGWQWWPGWRPRSLMPPRCCSPAWGSRWPCTAGEVRARVLNLAAVGTSVFMNAIAAAPGWPNLAVWAMPPVAYALASDTLIGVVRAAALARHQDLGVAMTLRSG